MKKLMPLGPRVFVTVIDPVDDVTARAAAAGLHAVVLEENKPKPTQGIVVALGTDPQVHETLQIGDVVSFSKYAGTEQQVEGKTYRCLTLNELISVIREDSHQSQGEPSPGGPALQ